MFHPKALERGLRLIILAGCGALFVMEMTASAQSAPGPAQAVEKTASGKTVKAADSPAASQASEIQDTLSSDDPTTRFLAGNVLIEQGSLKNYFTREKPR